MTLIRPTGPPGPGTRAPLTRVPLSTAALPPIDPQQAPWPGQFVTSGGVRLHVRHTRGPTSETAVYVHGLAGSSTNWTDLAGQLAVRCQGLAVDLPGFGRTPPPEGHDFSVLAHTDVLVRFLSGLGAGPVHLLGNSFGGTVAILTAATRPDLVRTLTLVSPAVPDRRPSLGRLSDRRLPLALLPGAVGRRYREMLAAVTPSQRVEQMLRLCFANPDDVPEHRLAQAVEEYTERNGMPWAGDALGRTTIGLIKAWLAPRARSLWRVLPQVHAPALVVWGTQDRLVSVRKAPRTAMLLPRGRLLVLPRTGHVAQMERPRSVARAVLGMWEAADRTEW
ncbi:Pimeloyl-ACP methyl ester carboxylesterase [Streptoalloteichus tenebrarius]|uniref:Pimeloyl-ACP methyl ester carboxylesterase n=1 Tax=Streptoalloteichus tenebrarius (strain ATCC 17920 / DSM 40477 / JCM 4838 / CBS 697.72 / NBRC 16177 / NCIMB 11028 / NRRL B-12390 / A12253. 1 / ISP 5477) TaxID=1933 RepID=A0ABT1HVQ4_STRSD|nr:alpha/beta fold hydrolase [Streptoalloteichus tenebrarius]MCP2259607.1 Pimeloyl-ACP methyl ester carboxylesterase [Streptoalloteichus tenebrarius]BFF00987.1 alpha/beta fold hydrolase [Streptoalloteichus tenebrarius]